MKKEQMINSLIENGFELYEEMDIYLYNDYSVMISKRECIDLIDSFNSGDRVCIMNYKEINNKSMEIVLEDMSSSGIWILNSIEEVYDVLEVEEELDIKFKR